MALKELQVMVVEDHGFQRRIAVRLLAELGVVKVLEGADGLHALEVLRLQAAVPDVVLVDLDMPGMDGIECIGHIAQERLARAVVVVSALDPALLNTVQTMARAYGLRVLGSVEKPLTRDKLESTLNRIDQHAGEEPDDAVAEFGIEALREALQAGEITAWFQRRPGQCADRPHARRSLPVEAALGPWRAPAEAVGERLGGGAGRPVVGRPLPGDRGEPRHRAGGSDPGDHREFG